MSEAVTYDGATQKNSETQAKEDGLVVESLDFAHVIDADVEELKQFLAKERAGSVKDRDTLGMDAPGVGERLNAQVLHALNGLKAIEIGVGKRGHFIRVRNERGEIVGFGVINLFDRPDPEQATLYFGRAWEESGKGIAHKILLKEADLLRAEGVHKYIAHVSDNSRRVYEKSGLRIEDTKKTEQGTFNLLINLDKKSTPRDGSKRF